MRNNISWMRVVLAFVAVLLVAGPGLSVVGAVGGYPKPVRATVTGAANPFAFTVYYDNSTSVLNPVGVTASSSKGVASYTPGVGISVTGATGKVRVSGSFTDQGITVTASKIATL